MLLLCLLTRSRRAAMRWASGSVPGLQQSSMKLKRSMPDLTTYEFTSFFSRVTGASLTALTPDVMLRSRTARHKLSTAHHSLFFLQNHRINVPLPDFKCRTPRPISCQYHPLEQTSRYSVVRGENKRWMHLNGKLDTKGSDFANKLMYWNLELDSWTTLLVISEGTQPNPVEFQLAFITAVTTLCLVRLTSFAERTWIILSDAICCWKWMADLHRNLEQNSFRIWTKINKTIIM